MRQRVGIQMRSDNFLVSDHHMRVAYTSCTRRTLSEAGNVRRTDFRFTRRVTVTHDDLHRGRVSRRVIYRLTFMFTYRNARFIRSSEGDTRLFYVSLLPPLIHVIFFSKFESFFLGYNLCIKKYV